MSETESRFVEGVQEERWQAWLIPGGKEEYDKIQSGPLKTHVRSLARRSSRLTPSDKLEEYYDDIDRLTLTGEISEEESSLYLARIQERVEKLDEKEKGEGEKSDFERINHKIISDESLTDGQRNELIKKRHKLLEEAWNKGYFDGVSGTIVTTMKDSSWNDVHTNLTSLAQALENQGGVQYNSDSEKYGGIIKDAVEGYANYVSQFGLEYPILKPGDPRTPEELRRDNGVGNNEWKRRQTRVVRGHFFKLNSLNVDPHRFVGKNIEQSSPQPSQQETGDDSVLKEIRDIMRAQAQAGQQGQMDPDVFAQKFAEAMGKLPHERQLELYRDAEGAMMPVEITPTSSPEFFAKISKEEQEAWMARSALVIAAATKKAAFKLEMLYPNESGAGLTKDELKVLWKNKTGSFQATALYTHMIAENRKVSDVLGPLGQNSNLGRILEIQDDKTFEKLREKTRDWLGDNLGLSEEDARDAEQIGWNIVYTTSLLEDKDTKANQTIATTNPGQGRAKGSVSRLKNVATWVLMHPQERLEAKSKAGDRTASSSEREAWGAFGEWSLMMAKSGRALPNILPTGLIKNGLADLDVKVNQQNGRSVETNMEQYLNQRGKQIYEIANTNNNPAALRAANDQIINEINWNEMVNAPFFTHFADRVNPGVKIARVIGEAGFEVSLQDLANACRKVGVGKRYRENLLKVVMGGIDPTSVKLKSNLFNGVFWESKWNSFVNGVNKDVSFFN